MKKLIYFHASFIIRHNITLILHTYTLLLQCDFSLFGKLGQHSLLYYLFNYKSPPKTSVSHAGLNSDLFNPADESNLRW